MYILWRTIMLPTVYTIVVIHSIHYTVYVVHSIYSTVYINVTHSIWLRPQYIIPPLGYTVDAASHLGYMLWVTLLYTVVVSILCIYCGLHIYCGVYTVGNMGIYCGWHLYTVEICCGVHFFLLYTVGYIYCGLRVVHSIYRVVHSIYILWSICCGCTHVLPMYIVWKVACTTRERPSRVKLERTLVITWMNRAHSQCQYHINATWAREIGNIIIPCKHEENFIQKIKSRLNHEKIDSKMTTCSISNKVLMFAICWSRRA